MTKFEKISKRVELLEVAYNAIIEKDKWDNGDYKNDFVISEDKIEEHDFYISVAKEIEKML